LIYDILAERGFTKIAERLRDDITSRFETLREGCDSAMRRDLGSAADSILERWKPETIEYLRDRFVIAALPHFAKIATRADRTLIREFCASPTLDVSFRAAVVLAEIGDESDVDLLLKLRPKLWGERLEEVVDGAIGLATDKAALLTMLLQDEKAGKISTLLGRHLLALPAASRIRISKAMLQSEVTALRLQGVRVLCLTMDSSELVDLLSAYVEQETYYYDIVSWLDKLVYSPEPYHDLYVEELKRLT
jgi:hypothetical protein